MIEAQIRSFLSVHPSIWMQGKNYLPWDSRNDFKMTSRRGRDYTEILNKSLSE